MELSEKTATLRDYLRILFRRKVILVITIIPVVIINYVMYAFITPTYTASVKMLLKGETKTQADYYQDVRSDSDAIMYSHGEKLRSNYVIERVVKALKLYELPADREKKYASPLKRAWIEYMYVGQENPSGRKLNEQEALINNAIGTLRGQIELIPVPRTSIFTINVTDFDYSLAARTANALSRSYIIYDLEQQIAELKLKYGDKHSTVLQLENHIGSLMAALDGRYTPAIEAIGPATIKIVEQAEVFPMIRKSIGAILVFAFFAGLILGLTLIVIIEYFDQTIKSPNDVEAVFNTGLLGSVPKIKSKNKLINNNTGNQVYLSAYKRLSDNIYMKMQNKQLKSVLITDADDSTDTPNIIANLGIYLSHYEGHKVLLVDVNLRSPKLAETFNIAVNGDLIDVLEERISYEGAIQDIGLNLHILSPRIPYANPVAFLDSKRMIDLINAVRVNYDVVFVYCADLKNFKDAIILASFVDGTIIVLNEGRTHKQVTKHIMEPLYQKKANLIGAILNDRTYNIPNIIYKLT